MISVVLCMLSCALVGYAENATDSVAAAITVYRNPEFFARLNRNRERLEPMDEDKEDVFNSDGFYDFEDDFLFPGEPKKPKPPAAPEFAAYYDEPQQPRESQYREERHEDDLQDENELNEDDEEQEHYEEDEEAYEEEPKGKYQDDPRGTYEDSKEYYNPVFRKELKSFSYPGTYEDLDYYDQEKPVRYADNKKGTREYLRDHSVEEVEDPKRDPNIRADTKTIFKTMSKIGFKALHPIFFVHVPKKIKYKYVHTPRKFKAKFRFVRELPDDSAYQLSSDYDSDFEVF